MTSVKPRVITNLPPNYVAHRISSKPQYVPYVVYPSLPQHNISTPVTSKPPATATTTPIKAKPQSYVLTPIGILNLLLIIFFIPCFLSVIFLWDPKYLPKYPGSPFNISYLVLAPLGFLVEIVILLVHSCCYNTFDKITGILFLVKDFVFGGALLGLGVLASIGEYNTEVRMYNSENPTLSNKIVGNDTNIFGPINDKGYNVGAYASAAGCAFIVGILSAIQAGFVLKRMHPKKN